MKLLQQKLAWALVFLMVALFQNCGSSDPQPADVTNEYFGTQSPGDAWTAAFVSSRSTFVLVWDNGTSLVTTDDVTLQGTYEKLTNGFIQMKVTSVNPTRPAIPTAPFNLFAVEIPGKSLLILPPQSSKLPVITMSAVSTRTGTNGVTSFNYIRTAFPKSSGGYDHITGSECWGSFDWNINETSGDVSISTANVGRTLSCAESDINANVVCVQANTSDVPVNTKLGEIDAQGRFKQTINATSGDPVFRGQFTINQGLFVMDSGDGQGGMFMVKKDPTSTLSDFMGKGFIGFESYQYRIGSSSTFNLTQGGARMTTFQPDSAVIISYNDIATDDLKPVNSYGVKFKQNSNGIVKGYLWTLGVANAPLVKYPFVGVLYNRDGKQMLMLLSGRKIPNGATIDNEQWLFQFVLPN